MFLLPLRHDSFNPSPVSSIPTNVHQSLRRSPLWSSSTANSNHNENNDNGHHQQQRKRDLLLSMVNTNLKKNSKIQSLLQKFMHKSQQLQKKLQVRFSAMLMTALLAFAIFFGGTANSTNNNNFHDNTTPTKTPIEIPYSRFMDYCEQTSSVANSLNPFAANQPRVVEVQIGSGSRLTFQLSETKQNKNDPSNPQYATQRVEGTTADQLIQYLRQHKIPFHAASAAGMKASTGGGDLGMPLVVGGMAFYLYQKQRQNPGQGFFSSSKDNEANAVGLDYTNGMTQTSFDDIEGIGEAKEAVLELVDTLRNPEKYRLVGARPPTGLLLEGPPGTGKTTLARAAASMADVPFLSASGSEFVEKYVGQGATRVRQLFERAQKIATKQQKPCIIFIDEIDALGKARGGGGGNDGGNSQEAEHTLIQLLTCMDGLYTTRTTPVATVSNKNGTHKNGKNNKPLICVLGATNRKDILDKALVRPGRFDRIIKVDLPDATGRERILRVHAQKLVGFSEGSGVDPARESSLGRGRHVDLSAVAAATDGLSGAELEMIVNEAAIRAVRRVSQQLANGVDKSAIDGTIYPIDFEDSVESFFHSRNESQRNKSRIGFDIESSFAPKGSSGDVFYKKNSMSVVAEHLQNQN